MSLSSDLSAPLNHIFVDFENVQQVDLSLIGKKAVNFTLLLGAQQAKLDANLVEKLLQHAAQVQFIRLSSPGRNALDFALAYYVGRAVMADPGGSFHIVSRDTGYDPLVEHLRSRSVHVRRYDDFSRLPFARPLNAPVSAPAQSPPKPPVKALPAKAVPVNVRDVRPFDPLPRVLANLRRNEKSRPKSRKSLLGYLLATGGTVSETDAITLIERLETAGHVSIGANGLVTYPAKKSPAFVRQPAPPQTPPPKPTPAPPSTPAPPIEPAPEPRRSMWDDSECFPF